MVAPWVARMESYQCSGLTQKKFCEENNIDYTEFKNNRSRLTYHKKKEAAENPGFAEIKIEQVKQKSLKISLSNGVECSLPPSLSDKELIVLVRGLYAC